MFFDQTRVYYEHYHLRITYKKPHAQEQTQAQDMKNKFTNTNISKLLF